MTVSPHRRDGFTLVETIIMVVLIGLIATALAAAISVFVRNEGSVSTRLTHTRDLQNLTNFLPGDVASARVVESNMTGNSEDAVTSATCGTGGAVLLHLEWTEQWNTSFSSLVTYRAFPDAVSPTEVVRFECENATVPWDLKVASAFDTVSIELQRDTSGPPAPLTGTVEIEFVYPDGEFKRITATSRHFLP